VKNKISMSFRKNSVLALVLAASVATTHAQTTSRPNIVFILADDLGYGDVGFNGQQKIRTPHIDQLAKNGMVFNQFYAGTSVCAPSRSSIMSGQHTGHTYIRGNKGVEPEGQEPIKDSIITVAEVLQSAGYRTGAFGKWGLGPVGSEGDPIKQGFNNFYGYNCQGLAHRYYPTHLWDNDKKISLVENGDLIFNKQYAPDLIQEKALAFIDESKKDEPFFLFLPYILPHAELLVPDDSIFQSYKGKFPETPFEGKDYGAGALRGGYASTPYPHASFASMITRLDLYVGQVIAKLKEKGLDKNTLVIFTSDNGPHKEGGADPVFFNSGGGFKGTKRDLYEGGIREPFVASWPGVVKPSSTSNHIGAFWDLMPTFAQLAKGTHPANTDGISFVPALTGKGSQKAHNYLYWEFHEQGGRQALRQGKWKAIRQNVDIDPNGPIELYDLTVDSGETKNVAAQFPEVAKKLAKLIDEAHVPSALFPFAQEKK
jgi:arylsulfatase A